MNCEDDGPSDGLPCSFKCGYKAIENFFRRIAFNLGNTPSQTDVKIISCIPIDVADLQQKILSLEEQLREAEQNKQKQNTYNTEILTYPVTVSNGFLKHNLGLRSSTDDQTHNLSKQLNKENNIYNMGLPKTYDKYEDKPNRKLYLKPQNFVNIDRMQKKRNTKLYNSVTNSSSADYEKDHGTNCSTLKDPYLSKMAEKQYRSSVVYESKDLITSLSSPICREYSTQECTHTSDANTYTSYFKNINKQKKQRKSNYLHNTKQVYTMRNDNQCDMLPVKEKAIPEIHYNEKKLNELYNNMEMTCSPNKIRKKSKIPPKTMYNYNNNMDQTRSNSCYIDCGKIYPKRVTQLQQNISEYKESSSNEINNSRLEIKPELKFGETEESLRQIKSILQTVLQEVKANSNDIRKDAPTHSDNKNVNYLKTITNDKYNCGTINGQNVAFSPYHPGNLCPVLPIQPLQYLQPLMMQQPAYYPHCNHIKNTTGYNRRRHLNTIGTNTDHKNHNENQSNNLIKEIYKSLNVNLERGDLKENTSNLINNKDNEFRNNIQIYNSRQQKLSSISEHSKKRSPKGILINNSLNVLDKETEVENDEDATSMTGSYTSDVTTKTFTTVTEKNKRKRPNFFTKFLKSFKLRKDKNIIPKKEIKFKEDVETIEDSNSESEDYSVMSTERMADYGRAAGPRRNIIKFEKKPKSIYRYYRNPFLEQEYRGILEERQVNSSPKTPLYWHNYDTRPVLLNNPVNYNKIMKPKYVKDKVVYSQGNNKTGDSHWLQKYKTNVQKCGQNWKSFVLQS